MASVDHVTLQEYKFGDRYTEEYKPYNRFVDTSLNVKEILNRMYILNEILKGNDFEDIQLIEIENIDFCVYGHGWIVYMDENNRLMEFVIDKFRDDEELKQLIEDVKKKYFGGRAHENKRL